MKGVLVLLISLFVVESLYGQTKGDVLHQFGTIKMKMVYDTTIKFSDLHKIKDLNAIMRIPKSCDVYEYEVSFRGKFLQGEIFHKSDSLTTKLGYYIDHYCKACNFIIVQVTKASCKLYVGNGYKIKLK